VTSAERTGRRSLLLRHADLGAGRRDVRVTDGRVAMIGDLLVEPGEQVVDMSGAAVLPGLHDHHIHLLALAAANRSVQLGPPDVRDARQLAEALRAGTAALAPGQWLRGIGYHDSVAGPLDRWVLDELVGDRPVRVQHRSGALWIFSSAAVTAADLVDADLDGIERNSANEPTGRIWRLDEWLRERVPPEPIDLAAVGRSLLQRGVTGVTDATPVTGPEPLRLLAEAIRRGDLPQRVVVTGAPGLPQDAVPGLERGPVKVLLPDHEPPDLDALLSAVRAARTTGRAVAIHCVTAVAAALAVAAVEEVGPHPGDRIEHGAVLPLALAARLAELGMTVVTNPGFVTDRGDRYRVEVDPADVPDLWRCRSLLEAGVRVGAGTDAPFGRADPWAAIAAAVDRRTADGHLFGPDERLDPQRALDLFLAPLERPGGPPRAIEVGVPADLCLLATPLAEALADPEGAEVVASVVGGVLDWHA
jgi:predicted amidohydrolase YtcJ